MSETFQHILTQLPYSEPFLFVDTLEKVTDEGVTGSYTFATNADFYKGHFKDHPVTPGVILTECMAQIGVVCLGIHLFRDQPKPPQIALTHHEVDFFLPVYPGERVTVLSEKEYFRFQKLKCNVQMRNGQGQLVCKGSISGMIPKAT